MHVERVETFYEHLTSATFMPKITDNHYSRNTKDIHSFFCYFSSSCYFSPFYQCTKTPLIAKTLGKYYIKSGLTSALNKSQVWWL